MRNEHNYHREKFCAYCKHSIRTYSSPCDEVEIILCNLDKTYNRQVISSPDYEGSKEWVDEHEVDANGVCDKFEYGE